MQNKRRQTKTKLEFQLKTSLGSKQSPSLTAMESITWLSQSHIPTKLWTETRMECPLLYNLLLDYYQHLVAYSWAAVDKYLKPQPMTLSFFHWQRRTSSKNKTTTITSIKPRFVQDLFLEAHIFTDRSLTNTVSFQEDNVQGQKETLDTSKAI